MNVFDFDGVVSVGIHPGPDDVIVTGRGYDEAAYVYGRLRSLGVLPVAVYFNPMTKAMGRSREQSGSHKAGIIRHLASYGNRIGVLFEDDEVQKNAVEQSIKLFDHPSVREFKVCLVNSHWVEK